MTKPERKETMADYYTLDKADSLIRLAEAIQQLNTGNGEKANYDKFRIMKTRALEEALELLTAPSKGEGND